ncbi:hypothetical protein L9F63_014795, partial [Diploptera punctata]
NDEITYAELSLPKQSVPMYGTSTLIHQRPQQEHTVYAQIDVTKKLVPAAPEERHTSALPLLHHTHLTALQQPLHILQQHPPTRSEDAFLEQQLDAKTSLILSSMSSQHREST